MEHRLQYRAQQRRRIRNRPAPPLSKASATEKEEKKEEASLKSVEQRELKRFADLPRPNMDDLKRTVHQVITASVLTDLAHEKHSRRRLAALEMEKVLRAANVDQIRSILLLLNEEYINSTSEHARKGGVLALAACVFVLKKNADADDCREMILAAVVHACRDHSQRVRYYAAESLYNIIRTVPSLVVQHFFALFETIRSLYAGVDAEGRTAAGTVDKKAKEIVLQAINMGDTTVEACIPLFCRYLHMSSKSTQLLALTWLQDLNVIEHLHLLLAGVFDMVADPTVAVRQSALAFLQSMLPKILTVEPELDFDKILQSLVITMEHPDPFVRKVAMYWMSRIVKAHLGEEGDAKTEPTKAVQNSVPHVLPGIFLSIGDSQNLTGAGRETFLPVQTTRSLAEQTNECLQDAVRREGKAFTVHLDAFIVALRAELDIPGGTLSKNPPAVERLSYRNDVRTDGNGIESPGWFRDSADAKNKSEESMIMSRLCALDWIVVLYESSVPLLLKADFAREFVQATIAQLKENPPKSIVQRSLEVLAKITIYAVDEERQKRKINTTFARATNPAWASSESVPGEDDLEETAEFPMGQKNVQYALQVLTKDNNKLQSRDRSVFSSLVELYGTNRHLLVNFSGVLTYMCSLQPPELVFASFSVELDRFLRRKKRDVEGVSGVEKLADELQFMSSFVQHMNHVLLNTDETLSIRNKLKDCMCKTPTTEEDRQKARLFHILLYSFANNVASTVALCLLSGAYRTASRLLGTIDPLDINLDSLLEIDRVVEMLERPFFRHLHIRMLEQDADPNAEGSGRTLFQLLKSLLMILPQSTCYRILKDRLTGVARFRQGALVRSKKKKDKFEPVLIDHLQRVRAAHCAARWDLIRSESLEVRDSKKQTIATRNTD